MSDENLKVRDLPEEEKKELLAQMQEAGCKGFYLDYKVITAKQKIYEYKNKNTEAKPQNEEIEIETSKNESNVENKQQDIIQEKIKETKICHICRTPRTGDVCPTCGFYIKR